MSISLHRLAYGLGAEVSGVDMSKPVDARTVAEIRQGWLDHQMLLFRDQDMTREAHIAFSRNFGELQTHQVTRYHVESGHPEIMEITNRVVDGKVSETAEVGREWHSDGAFSTRPPAGSLLHCREMPDVGGDTWFTNMYMAYDALSPQLRKIVDQLEVVNDLTIAWGHIDPEKVARSRKDVPPVVQRMVRIHPETGRKALYLSRAVTRQIHGMTEDESRGLLNYLFDHSVRAEFTYRHRWRINDVIMWDNRCSMHLAPSDYDKSKLRLMCRTTIMGEPLGRLYQAELAANAAG